MRLPGEQIYSPNLEEHLRTHTEEAVNYPESEHHRHAVDKPTPTPRQRVLSQRERGMQALQTQEPRK